MTRIWPQQARLAGLALLLMAPVSALAEEAGTAPATVTVTPVLSTSVTATGQPIVFPAHDGALVVATYEIAQGAVLPEHKHPHPRTAYVLEGTLRVDNTETGTSATYAPGDFIVEAIDQWHKGTNVGDGPVKLLVIDMIEQGAKNTVMKE